MDLRNVKDLEGKMRICNIIYPIGVGSGIASLAAGYIVSQFSYGWGIFLCCLAVVLALIGGIAQVMESYLYAEDMYRITGHRPKEKTQDDPVKNFIREYAETAGRKTMEDALRLGKELDEKLKDEKDV